MFKGKMTQSPNIVSINWDLRGGRSNISADSEARDQSTTLLSVHRNLFPPVFIYLIFLVYFHLSVSTDSRVHGFLNLLH